MISEYDLAKNERDAAAIIDNPRAFSAQIYDAAKAIKELCSSLRETVHALRKVSIVSHHRMAEGGGTVPAGFSCEICGVECDGKLNELRHMSECPLYMLWSPGQAVEGRG